MVKMAVRRVLFFVFCFSVANSEYVSRKFCQNACNNFDVSNFCAKTSSLQIPWQIQSCGEVDPSKCSIHSVKLDPCPDGPGFCLLRREKPYRLSFDFTPRFEARSLKLSLHSDDDNSGSFTTVIAPAHDACDHRHCPLEDNVRTVYDVDFVFVKKTYGKFPIQMKLWNEDNETEVCCFTFNVKMLK